MLKNLQHFQQPDSNKEMLRQASVQCNEVCEIVFPQHEPIKARLTGLHWTGFTLDQVPKETWESRDGDSSFQLKFAIPRQFGHVKLELQKVKWQFYVDVISGRDMVSIHVELADETELKKIQDFLIYRNKSFIRRSKRRLKKTLAEKSLYVFWVFIGAIGLLWGLILLKDALFES
jgi:hypothetical protein